MLKKISEFDASKKTTPKEGDLYKIIELRGSTFEIRYGFYEECDRYSRYAEPMEIYPNFRNEPQYTDDGMPFVTAFQDPCKDFKGPLSENSTCEECVHYRPGEELIGICTHPEKHCKDNVRRMLP
jgi:hypothetical protein